MDLKIKSLNKKYNQINTSNQKARKHLLPIIDKEISEITKKWLKENDSRAKFKLTDRYKKRQQAKLAKKQARKQKYLQKLSLVRRGLYQNHQELLRMELLSGMMTGMV
jgi:hypothetical protein